MVMMITTDVPSFILVSEIGIRGVARIRGRRKLCGPIEFAREKPF